LIKALVDGLSFKDADLVCAVIDALSHVLKVGADANENGENRYFHMMEECDGSRILEDLQEDENEHVYNKAVDLIQKYCVVEEDEDACDTYVEKCQFDFGN